MGVACSYLAAKVLKIQRLDSQDFLSSVVGPSALPSASASAWSTGAIAPSLQSCPPGLRCALLQTWQV
jgi:hypothetical protein